MYKVLASNTLLVSGTSRRERSQLDSHNAAHNKLQHSTQKNRHKKEPHHA